MEELDITKLPLKKPSQLSEPELIAFYGPPGNGKSWLAASASEVEGLYPVLVLDTEGSAAGTLTDFDDERVDILSIDNYAQLESILTGLTEKSHKYKTVIIDTFDVAQKRTVDHLLEQHKDNTFAAWGEARDWTVEWARALKSAPFLAILVFHEATVKSETGLIETKLMLQGSAKDVLPGVPDVVGWVSRKIDKEEKREITTIELAPDPKKATKNRFKLEAKIKEPTMSKIYDHIRNNKKESN